MNDMNTPVTIRDITVKVSVFHNYVRMTFMHSDWREHRFMRPEEAEELRDALTKALGEFASPTTPPEDR